MTDNQTVATAIITGCTLLGAAIRLSVHALKGLILRVVKAIDDSTAAWAKTSDTVSVLTQKLVGLEAKLDTTRALQDAVEKVVDEVSGVHEAANADSEDTGEFSLASARTPIQRKTPRGGYAVQRRPRSRGA